MFYTNDTTTENIKRRIDKIGNVYNDVTAIIAAGENIYFSLTYKTTTATMIHA